jgi:adenylate cyclase
MVAGNSTPIHSFMPARLSCRQVRRSVDYQQDIDNKKNVCIINIAALMMVLEFEGYMSMLEYDKVDKIRGKIKIRIGFAYSFIVVMLPLITSLVYFNYQQNEKIALQMANASMAMVAEGVTDKTASLLTPVHQAVASLASLARLDRNHLRSDDSIKAVFETLRRLPDVTSLYVGFQNDGAFVQLIRLRPGLEKLGPELRPIPQGAAYVVRKIEQAQDGLIDDYNYLKDWGESVGRERIKSTYDPRERSWYRQSYGDDVNQVSDVYVFSGTGSLGITVSRRFENSEGRTSGVAGADLSLNTLSRFLDQRRVGANGVIFVMDEHGRLVVHPDPKISSTMDGDRLIVAQARDAADPVVSQAVRMRGERRSDAFTLDAGANADDYLVSFKAFPSTFGRAWMIGIATPLEEFIGPIRRSSMIFLFFGAGAVAVVVVASIFLSRQLSRPIQDLIEESDRIRQFDLAPRKVKESRLIEVNELAQSFDRMKSGIRMFSTYVPKELVRQIMQNESHDELNGVRRPVTILFSDIKGFTSISESLAPEDVFNRLSQYFDVMSREIHASGGVIDKFIGDAVMGIWNAPSSDERHAESACRAVVACMRAERSLNEIFVSRGYAPFVTRFGLHSGVAAVGNVGSRDRVQYTALGGMVNLASRIEGLNKKYGTYCLITGPVEEATRGKFLVRKVDVVIPVGTTIPTPLFELIDDLDMASAEDAARCARWLDLFAVYQAGDWGGAVRLLDAYLADWPTDVAAENLRKRCQGFIASPPDADWNGAIAFDSK